MSPYRYVSSADKPILAIDRFREFQKIAVRDLEAAAQRHNISLEKTVIDAIVDALAIEFDNEHKKIPPTRYEEEVLKQKS